MHKPLHAWHEHVDLELVRAIRPLVRALSVVHPTRIEGADNVPDGPALLVGNHGLLGYETLLFFERLFAATGRMPRGLADRWFFRVPVIRDLLVRLGGVYAEPGNAQRLLERGELTVCYPGGAREVLKRSDQDRYRLRWEASQGFVRVALRAGVPIVPFAAAGVDDTFNVLTRIKGSGQFLMGHDKYDLPVLFGVGPLPMPVPFWFRVGRPIVLQHARDAADDPDIVRSLHEAVWRSTQAMLDELVRDWQREHRPDAPRRTIRRACTSASATK